MHAFRAPALHSQSFTSADGNSFPYRVFQREKTEPHTVIIALHGFCGASLDYEYLGNYLMRNHPRTALYAYDIRGQGRDPVESRRGDIADPALWYQDLLTFTQLVRQQHPHARIIWQGESMGALIASHAYGQAVQQGRQSCDALILTSPVVSFPAHFPAWKKDLLSGAAHLLPELRLSVQSLAGGESLPMTAHSNHLDQAETNAWNIDRHTLRSLHILARLVESMPTRAPQMKLPVLVMHGGLDVFAPPHDIAAFYDSMPKGPNHKRIFFPQSHHLLMYDEDKDAVVRRIGRWVQSLQNS